jgi:hypothetical protein
MSSEERSPENKRNIKGKKNKAIQGDYNQVFEGGIKIVFALFNWFSPTTSSSPSSRHKLPKLNGIKLKLWIKLIIFLIAFLAIIIGAFGISDVFKPKDDASLKIGLKEEVLINASDCPGISLGEEILIKQDIPKKEELEKAFAGRDYQQFKNLLGDYLKQHPNSPELRVYWNNAKAALLSKNPIKIAVSIPIGTNPDIAQEILRGVALAQNEFNNRNNETGITDSFYRL